MSKEAMKLALEALEMCEVPWTGTLDHNLTEAITALREALAEQPAQQEPVVCRHEWFSTGAMETGQCRCIKCGVWNTTLPAQRTLVGLEKSDMPTDHDPMYDHKYFAAGMVYAANKLMEKNT